MATQLSSHKTKDPEEEILDEREWSEPNFSIDTIRPKKWWHLNLRHPSALSAERWEDFHKLARASFPFRYWLTYDVRLWFTAKWARIQDIKWWIRYRTTDRNHIIKLMALRPGYYDPDVLILESVFHLFNEFMQRQHYHGHVDWEGEYHIKEWTEMNEVWEWWKLRDARARVFEMKNPYPELPSEWGFLSVCNDRYREEPLMKEWKRVAELHRIHEAKTNEEEEDMLIRVIKLRRHLWD